jgi:hypothetical protein
VRNLFVLVEHAPEDRLDVKVYSAYETMGAAASARQRLLNRASKARNMHQKGGVAVVDDDGHAVIWWTIHRTPYHARTQMGRAKTTGRFPTREMLEERVAFYYHHDGRSAATIAKNCEVSRSVVDKILKELKERCNVQNEKREPQVFKTAADADNWYRSKK